MAFLSDHSQINRNSILPPVGLRFFIIIVLVLGVFFRFVNLDRKVYWFDETATTDRISSYGDYIKSFHGQIISIEDLHKYQRLNHQKSVSDVIKGGLEEPQLPPLYFLILRLWLQWFGNSVAITRSLSALLSLLVFPCIYWLCLELFQSSLVGWIAVALIAVSPFHVLYAQEARMYSLHTVTILLSGAALLSALRLKTKLSWGLYSTTLSLGFYTHTLFLLVAIGHGIYVVAIERTRLTKVLIAYLIASFVGLLTFAPWLFVIITNFGKAQMTLDWVNRKIPWSILVTYWGINISRIFLDLTPNYRLDTDLISFYNPLSTALIITLLILVGYSIYFMVFSTQKSVWLFVLTLIGVIALSLALPDLLFGGIRSNNVRYLIASYLGIHLSIAYLLATKLESNHTDFWRKKMWQIAIVFIILCGTVSCVVSSQADTWWNKYYGSNLPQIARIVNRSTHPILIFDSEFASQIHVEPISYILDSKVKFKILNAGNINQIPDEFSDVFFLNPSENLQDKIERNHQFKIEPIYKKELSLWKLEKQ